MSIQESIRRAANGTWSLVVDVPSVAGKRQQIRRRGFATKKEAQAVLIRLSSDVQRGTFLRPTKDRFGVTWPPRGSPGFLAATAWGLPV